ncbi:sterol desaturase family protein [Fulvivirgaceae bacterium PWU4]|uniref:Sterol desaturase family protein n=1 Tax=Chryseosolibacter histidini TaxID=2782349 RepID=A0AAP2GLU2_9BACT|nr:sterol desaturase family protein [Chryseosolibacter histidini]MBT1700479.1 sterol desaturase family protein [Chryseosolibacter histidini]
MALNWTALAIPAFFIFLGLEYIASVRKKRNLFTFESSVANISIGIAERLMNLFVSASFYGLFYYIYDAFALFEIPATFWMWIILLLATDLIWYWYHRLSHEINLFWAAHIVHHQSEDFNYTVSARITIIQAFLRNAFWCILPLLGFHPAMVISILVIHGTYSFFTHTQVIGKLGWFEHVLITPSHHRVHHASNEKYLNKNYGDLFIFWDKLFGTFQREEEQPDYGLTHPLKSYSFMWQHFHYFMEMFAAFRKAETFSEKFRVVFGKPEDLDQQVRKVLERKFLPYKTQAKSTLRFKAYLTLQMIFTIAGLFSLILFIDYADLADKVFATLLIITTLVNCGALLEQRRWIYYLEYLRLFFVTALLSWHLGSAEILMAGALFIIFSATSDSVKRWYLKFVYDL